MSTARLGGEGSSISPMNSLSAFMYAPLRMLPASLMADCSSGPMSREDPAGRRSMSSASRIAVGRGNTRSVRPVRSPSMCMSTAAIGSSGSLSCVGTSSSDEMLIVGTLIMIVLPVICESAVAACPAPMFATSRSASSWTAFNAVMSFIPSPLQKAAHVHDQRGGAVAQNRRATEERSGVANRVELLHHDVLLTRELVDDEPRATLA